MENQRYCQSCGMPMTEEAHFGTNADGSKNGEFCVYCFKGGAFTDSGTMEDMINVCWNFEKEAGGTRTEEEAKAGMRAWFPTLKRWNRAAD